MPRWRNEKATKANNNLDLNYKPVMKKQFSTQRCLLRALVDVAMLGSKVNHCIVVLKSKGRISL